MAKYNAKETIEKNTDSVDETKVEKNDSPKKEEKKSTPKPAKKKTFDPSEGIECRSVVTGQLFLEGFKTKMPYQWTNYGDVVEVEYRDLQALVLQKSGYVFNPFFIIDNEDFVEEFPFLKKFYEQNYTVKELNDILQHPVEQMISEIKALPKSAVDTLMKIASNQVALGQIDSVRKIKALDEIFDTDLNLISEITR